MKINDNNLKLDGKDLKIAIVLPYFNDKLGLKLYQSCKEELIKHGVEESNINLTRVAGALETPFAAQKIIKTQKPNALIAMGIVIRGETPHFDLVAQTTHQALMNIQLKLETPIIFNILTTENLAQAQARIHKGAEAAQAAIIQAKL
ncbi:6,7-dimethyl-8-ribityllumazine synthase [Patescibacteria group bacterium]|nr:6,7-dimethyl-8-ribityllumazine synthase [Patescibacteria group bacterium]